MTKFVKVLLMALCLALALFAAHCGGGGGGGTFSAPPGGGGGSSGGTVTITLSSLAPIVAMQNSSAFTLTVNGSGFASGDQVVFNGSAEAATITSSSQLTAQIPASAVSQPGSFSVTVESGSTTSAALNFYVVPAINPNAVSVGAGGSANADITLKPDSASTPLLLEAIGSSGSSSSSATIVKPGQAATLFIAGTGIQAGTYFQVTGGGVSVTQPVVSDFTQTTGAPPVPAVNLKINVNSTAAPGVRNLIVTDPSGEISVFPGGIIIG
ncbi:MAG: IPT/TIG domain-containing protein [Acidobacteriota bacterium]|nr:IPT/TIG domain-containing protein [Acidobacteriota bacterium]